MASAKMKALMAIVRFLISVAVGVGIAHFWLQHGAYGGEPFAYGAGFISVILAYLMLNKLKAAGD